MAVQIAEDLVSKTFKRAEEKFPLLRVARNLRLSLLFTRIAVTVDSSSNIYVAGYVGATAYGDTYAGGTSDAVVMSLDSDGALNWARLMGTSDGELGTGGMSLTMKCLRAV